MKNDSFKFRPFLIHLIFWLCFIALPYLMRPSDNSANLVEIERHNKWTLFFIIYAIANIPFFYLNTEILIQKIFKKYGAFWYLLLLIASISFMLWLNDEIRNWVFAEDHFNKIGKNSGFKRGPVIGTTFQLLFVVTIGITYRFFADNLKEKEIIKEAENERLKSELSFLRSQISPHFMFNVLNSVVSLSRRKPEMVEPVVIKLSELMRYMIYETTDAKVPLQKEAIYLESYIDLQKIRFGNDIQINFNVENITSSCSIEPMLLIPFVENAFKHGVGIVKNPSIDIHLSYLDKKLTFSVKNKANPASKTEKKDESSGIGLANVKRRLELLHPDNYELTIKEENDTYFICLEISNC
jgi:two-component system LytT family sensor kinase